MEGLGGGVGALGPPVLGSGFIGLILGSLFGVGIAVLGVPVEVESDVIVEDATAKASHSAMRCL